MGIKINPDVILNEKDILNDLNKFANIWAETIVLEAGKIISKFAFEQMVKYYNEYDPRFYKRKDFMKYVSYIPYYNKTGSVYEGGVWINPIFTDHPQRGESFSEEKLYDKVWIEGSHGWEKVGYGDSAYFREILGEPNRLDKIRKKAYSDRVKNSLITKGFRKAKSQSYSILSFR